VIQRLMAGVAQGLIQGLTKLDEGFAAALFSSVTHEQYACFTA
jgi:hypothetical protein